MLRYGAGFGRMLCALDFSLGKPKEIAIIGATDSANTKALRKTIWDTYLPNKVVAQSTPDHTSASDAISLLRNRFQIDDQATAYVCENFVCKQPVTTTGELASQLENRSATVS
jgi:uncharacterized protein YyaL (SSP411 family)